MLFFTACTSEHGSDTASDIQHPICRQQQFSSTAAEDLSATTTTTALSAATTTTDDDDEGATATDGLPTAAAESVAVTATWQHLTTNTPAASTIVFSTCFVSHQYVVLRLHTCFGLSGLVVSVK